MMKTTVLCFALALSVLPSAAYPQDVAVEPTESSMQTVNIKSPEAASFEKIGEIPVSLFTGVPQISIPLYEIDCGGYSFPITLDYQATAIKVNQEASWVGLNWLLNAGGAVTTRISKPESLTFESQWDLLLNKMQYNILTIDSLGQGYKVSGSHDGTSGNYGWNRFAGSINPDEVTNEFYSKLLDNYEGEALTFSANFMGYSFSFVYHPLEKRYIITGNDRKFKIEGSPVYVSKITDDKGIKYYFDEIEANNPASYRSAPYQKLNFSYYLTKIEYPNGRSVKLSYFKNPQSIRILPSVMESWNYGLPGGGKCRLEKKLSDLVELNSPYLQKIEADGVVIEFVLGTRNDLRNARRLDCIKISDADGNLVRRLTFKYDYFTSQDVGVNPLKDYYTEHKIANYYNSLYSTSETCNRLRLLSVTIEAQDKQTGQWKSLPPYEFTYNGSLPPKTSTARDYWGYYNGKTSNKNLAVRKSEAGEYGYNAFPYDINYGLETGFYASDRRCDTNYVKNGLLTSITYPTGGKTSFRYESHSFDNCKIHDASYIKGSTESQTITVSGSNNSNDSNPNKHPKKFQLDAPMKAILTVSFNKNDKSPWSGMVNKLLVHVFLYPSGYYGDDPYYPVHTSVLSPPDTLNAESDYHIVKSDTFLLKAGEYCLSAIVGGEQNIRTFRSISAQLNCVPFEYVSLGGGVRIKAISYNDGNGNISTTSYEYTADGGDEFSTSGMLMNPLRFARQKKLYYQQYRSTGSAQTISYWVGSGENLAPTSGPLVAYKSVTEVRPDGKIRHDFHCTRPGLSTIDYYPRLVDPENGNTKRTRIYSTDGSLVKDTEYEYTTLRKANYYINAIVEDIYSGPDGDYYALRCNGGRIMICLYTSSNVWIAKTRERVTEYTDEGTVKYHSDYTYNPRNLQVARVRTYYDTSGDGYGTSTHILYPVDYNTGIAFDYKTTNMLTMPVEVVQAETIGGDECIVQGTLYEYNSSGLPAAKHELELDGKHPLSSHVFSNGTRHIAADNDSVYIGAYRTTGYKPVWSREYTPRGNVSMEIGQDNVSTVCLWSYHGQYPVAQIVNATTSEVASAIGMPIYTLENYGKASFEALGLRQRLDDYFSGKPVLITTCTYAPLVGITSITQPDKLPVYYEYDSFGHLRSSSYDLDGTEIINQFDIGYR